MDFGQKVRERREILGVSQSEFARSVGMFPSRISEIESGIHPSVGILVLRKMARALGTSADYLIGTWEETSPSRAPRPTTTRRGRPRKPRPEALAAAGGPP